MITLSSSFDHEIITKFLTGYQPTSVLMKTCACKHLHVLGNSLCNQEHNKLQNPYGHLNQSGHIIFVF